ncbi:protein FAR1-RELATED SEQUENCE 6-like [Silene latifolia]|uniref:protein FAR1-RELATED SEQUENCE 6-like n=1 Tax=Silene latifolia TaxID=37657 RepID=UPI003D76FF1A
MLEERDKLQKAFNFTVKKREEWKSMYRLQSKSHRNTKVSWETFGENSIDYKPLFETTLDFKKRNDAFNWANKVAFENGFALVKTNNGAKNRKKNGLLASYFRCKRHGLPPLTDDPEKPRRSQKCSCKFRIRAVQNFVSKNDQVTIVRNIVTPEGGGLHNHNVAVYKDGDRNFAGLDAEEKAYVRQQTMAGVQPRDIKNALHLKTPEKPQLSSTQLYNETRKIRQEVRGEINTAQQMLALAVEAKYVHWHEINSPKKEITHIFMAHPDSVKLFRAYPYVVIMDSTYKTNMYNNPLIEMVSVTPTGSSFLIACSMIPTESEECYKWLLKKLGDILDVTGASPSVFVTDRELGLINALKAVFPKVDHLLCRWHVNKAINAKALEFYHTESIKAFIITNPEDCWNNVINALTEQVFQQAWASFSHKWGRMATYIGKAWGEHAGKFILCYTNEAFYLGNIATSRVESAHYLLKAWLKSSHLTLDTMWSCVHGMLEGQYSKIKKELEDSMSKPRITSRTFSILQGNVSTIAIELMEKELLRGLGLGIEVEDQCGLVLRTAHGLPCACKLVSLMKRGRRIHLEDVHIFWKTMVYDSPQQMPKNDGDLFEELVDGVRNSDPVYRRVVIDLLRDFSHPEDQEILPPPINEHPKGRPRGAPGAPLGRNFTIGLISSWAKRWGVLEVLWGHFDGWVDVGDDGHCGFWILSHGQQGQETDYIIMREWCAREMRSDDIYKQMFGIYPSATTDLTGFELALQRVEFFAPISCGPGYWMCGDNLLVFATFFNWTICVIGHSRGADGENVWDGICNTIMPLKTPIVGIQPYDIMWIVLHHNHWMRLHSRGPAESLPMPPSHPAWLTYLDASVSHLDMLYQ